MFRDRPIIEAASSPLCELPARTRSAVTNHKDLLPGLDGRSATARRFRDLVNAFVADMGGLDRCSEIRLGLVRRLAANRAGRDPRGRNGQRRGDRYRQLCTLASTTVRHEPASWSRASRDVSHRWASLPQNGTSQWRCSMDVEDTE